jgi:hypothetical protein
MEETQKTQNPPMRKIKVSPMVVGVLAILIALIVIVIIIGGISKPTPAAIDLTTEPQLQPYCGDGECNVKENCSSCSEDCGECLPAPICDNDGVCRKDMGETYEDCEDCQGFNVNCCGDGDCQETTCAAEGCCNSESCSSCPGDCGECADVEPGESVSPAAGDCLDCINVAEINGDAVGEDRYNLNDEYVTLRNRCDYSCELTGWTVKSKQGCTYTFPDFVLGSTERVRIYSGKGTDDDSFAIKRLYWRNVNTNCNEVWDDSMDNLYLKDSQGNVAQVYSYW